MKTKKTEADLGQRVCKVLGYPSYVWERSNQHTRDWMMELAARKLDPTADQIIDEQRTGNVIRLRHRLTE